MSDRVYDHKEIITERFPCGCLWQGHCLDLTLEFTEDRTELIECTFNLYMAGKASLKWRIKQALQCLKGNDGQLADFIFRAEDAPKLIELLGKVKPYYYTDGS